MLPYLPSIEAGALEDYVKSIYPTISILDTKLELIVQTNGSIQNVFINYLLESVFYFHSPVVKIKTFILELNLLHVEIQFILS